VHPLVPVRLNSEWRGNAPGSVIHTTPQLAEVLTSSGRAESAPAYQASVAAQAAVERAVARPGGAA
jgi:hypothetical protein